MTSPIILAIDPGYDRVGWAVGHKQAGQIIALDYGCISTQKSSLLIERYAQIDTELTEIIQKYHPQHLAIESLFFYNNKTTAMHVSEARGVIISAAFRHGLEFYEYTPLQIKQAVTGYGKADKKAVEKMVRLQLGSSLRQSKEKILDDTLDALGILLTHASSVQLKI